MPQEQMLEKARQQAQGARRTKTLYVREEDQAIWDQARELIGDSLSMYVTSHLKTLVATKKAEQQGFERIVVSYYDTEQHGLPRSKAFLGRWIIPPDKPYHLSNEHGDEDYYYSVAITAKSNLVVHKKAHGVDCHGDNWMGEYFFTFLSFEDAVANREVCPAIIEARQRLGVPTEELDI